MNRELRSPTMPDSINPTTGETLATHAFLSDDQLDAALGRASAASERQRTRPLAERVAAVHALADRLDADTERLARLATDEMGKTLAEARSEVQKCASSSRTLADMAEAAFADSLRASATSGTGARALVAYAPLGTVLAIMPWNFPYWQAIRAAVPVVLAGGTVLLKHADNVLGCAEALTEAFHAAGLGDGVFEHIPIETDRVAGVIADDRVAAVTLTGSEAAGRAVAKQAGAHLKPVVLELGGSDPFVVLADADIERAAEVAVTARMQNNGQSCIAAKRFIVEAPVADAFTEAFAARIEALVVGDPADDATDVGPLARADLRDSVLDQLARAATEGARVAAQARTPDGPGFYVAPTLLVDVAEDGVPYCEEVFGPVAALTVAKDRAEALRLANATRFGLGGSVWTADLDAGEAFARQIRAGLVSVNALVASRAEMPFGGVRASGVGRELGVEGLRQFVNVQSVWVE